MGNGTCHHQQPSMANIVINNSLPLPNSQSKSPSKPTIESVNPTIAKIEDDGPNISIEEIVLNNPPTPLSPQKKSKSKKSKRDKELLELLTKDKTFIRRSSQGLSPVKILSTYQKAHRTSFIIEHSELIKFKRDLENNNDESSKPKPILKTGSERSLSSPTQKKVKFGLIFKQL